MSQKYSGEKLRSRVLVLLVLISLYLAFPVKAYTDHNLEWGVESGVKYYYTGELFETTDGDLDGIIDEVIDWNFIYYGLIEEGYPTDVHENVTALQEV